MYLSGWVGGFIRDWDNNAKPPTVLLLQLRMSLAKNFWLQMKLGTDYFLSKLLFSNQPFTFRILPPLTKSTSTFG